MLVKLPENRRMSSEDMHKTVWVTMYPARTKSVTPVIRGLDYPSGQ